MRLALETATARASVALGTASANASVRELVGARRHAAELLPMIDAVLRDAGARLSDVRGIVLSDGPGSFTGLRVGAAVAKALVQARGLPLWSAPSLMVRAAGVAQPGATILAVADALRGEVYAAVYRFEGGGVQTLLAPIVRHPDELMAGAMSPDVIVGEIPDAAAGLRTRWPGIEVIGPPTAVPHARVLLDLVGRSGGAVRVDPVEGWQPVYGRPAEAQARWETAHGRPLPDSIGSRG
ncbi:MAG: tRNA (adenosine(37)-N6)-threonylcarbamoyltransferase complex dimerization subunit type 1 TsaB [Gemmatimonadales bacterium]